MSGLFCFGECDEEDGQAGPQIRLVFAGAMQIAGNEGARGQMVMYGTTDILSGSQASLVCILGRFLEAEEDTHWACHVHA